MNVLNVNEIERELRSYAAHATMPQAKEWVASVPRNYLLGSSLDDKDLNSNFRVYVPKSMDMPAKRDLPAWAKERLKAGETLHWFDPIQVSRRPFWQALRHIISWFNFLPKTDTRFHRLTRMNFSTAAGASGMWAKDIATNVWHYVKDNPPLIADYGTYKWHMLTTPLHFEREGNVQGQCIGNGYYYDRYTKGTHVYYSLRSAGNNEPHASLEVQIERGVKKLVQCKGKGNSKPIDMYQPHIKRFIAEQKLIVAGDSSMID